jgi:hypothetical protein
MRVTKIIDTAEKLRQDQHTYVENAIAMLKQQKGTLSDDEEAFARMDAFSAWVDETIHVEDFSEPLRSILREYERAAAKEREAREQGMAMIDEQPRCQGPACNQSIVVIPGHRRRQYCSDTCKMAAHRARIARENQARYEALQLELAQREREALRQRWGDLPPEAFDLLRSLRMTYGIVLAERVAGVLQVVRDEARKSLAEERAALIDEIMLAGEQLDFPLIVTEAFDLAPTVFCWSAFCGNASIEQLRQAREAAHLKVLAKNGRLRLAQQT